MKCGVRFGCFRSHFGSDRPVLHSAVSPAGGDQAGGVAEVVSPTARFTKTKSTFSLIADRKYRIIYFRPFVFVKRFYLDDDALRAVSLTIWVRTCFTLFSWFTVTFSDFT